MWRWRELVSGATILLTVFVVGDIRPAVTGTD
jgi:hypothetical protein